MKDVVKYKRGQVWMRRDNSTYKGSVQSNNRPCLIISNDRGNSSQSSVIIAKITSVESKSSLGVNVSFTNDKGYTNVILCNQIETVNTSELSHYLFTVSDNLMTKVEDAVLLAQGIAYEKDIPKSISQIYTILSKLETIKADNLDTVDKDQEMILQTADKLKELYGDLAKYYEESSDEIKSRIDPYSQYLARKELGLLNKPDVVTSDTLPDELNNQQSEDEKPRKYRKWTKESMEEFISDRGKMTINELADKWGFEDTKKCSQTYYITKKRYNDRYGK